MMTTRKLWNLLIFFRSWRAWYVQILARICIVRFYNGLLSFAANEQNQKHPWSSMPFPQTPKSSNSRSHRPGQTNHPRQTNHPQKRLFYFHRSFILPLSSIRPNGTHSQAQPIRTLPIRTPFPLHHTELIKPFLPLRRPAANIPLLTAPRVSEAFGRAVAAPPRPSRFLRCRVRGRGLVCGPVDGRLRRVG